MGFLADSFVVIGPTKDPLSASHAEYRAYPLSALIALGGARACKKMLLELGRRTGGTRSPWVKVACTRILSTAFSSYSAVEFENWRDKSNPVYLNALHSMTREFDFARRLQTTALASGDAFILQTKNIITESELFSDFLDKTFGTDYCLVELHTFNIRPKELGAVKLALQAAQEARDLNDSLAAGVIRSAFKPKSL